MIRPVRVNVDHDLRLIESGRWDALLAGAEGRSPYLRSEWLLPWYRVFGDARETICPTAHIGEALVGAGAFIRSDDTIELLGRGPSGALDVLVRSELDESTKTEVTAALIRAALKNATTVALPTLDAAGVTRRRLAGQRGLYLIERGRRSVAPRDIDVGGAALRCDPRGAPETLHFRVVTSANAVLERLTALFALHVSTAMHDRATSPMSDAAERRFLGLALPALARNGAVRLVEGWHGDRCVAVHLGLCSPRNYVGYVAAFDPGFDPRLLSVALVQAVQRDAASAGAVELVLAHDVRRAAAGLDRRSEPTPSQRGADRAVIDLHVTSSATKAIRIGSTSVTSDAAQRVRSRLLNAWRAGVAR